MEETSVFDFLQETICKVLHKKKKMGQQRVGKLQQECTVHTLEIWKALMKLLGFGGLWYMTLTETLNHLKEDSHANTGAWEAS